MPQVLRKIKQKGLQAYARHVLGVYAIPADSNRMGGFDVAPSKTTRL